MVHEPASPLSHARRGTAGFRIALAALGILASIVVNMVVGVFHQGQWLSLFFGLAFSLALLSEIAMSSGRTKSPLAASVVAGVAILAAGAVLLDWESIVFMLLFLAIWLAS